MKYQVIKCSFPSGKELQRSKPCSKEIAEEFAASLNKENPCEESGCIHSVELAIETNKGDKKWITHT